MKSLQKNETWELVDRPAGKKPVGCRWIYTVKYQADGTIERFKARLVAKGYTQTYGIDYTDTFAPVAKINTVRVLLSLAANLDWPLQQFDVKNAFLHGELTEEVYMDPPPGYMPERHNQKVCRLKKALYGLKQSPRAWFGRFTKSMINFGYHQSNSDHTLMYLAHTRPDLAYALSIVSQFMHNPGEKHMNAVMRILRYLKSAPGKGILFAKKENFQNVITYTDADWAGSIDNRRSTSGYFTFVGGNLKRRESHRRRDGFRRRRETEANGQTSGLIASMMGFDKISPKSPYLGLPLFRSGFSKDFNFLLERLESKLASWKYKVISKAKRMVLIKSIALSLPIYTMQYMKLPKSVCAKLDVIIINFWWSASSSNHSLCLKAWSDVCQPKQWGGLGFRRMHDLNISFLAKWAWSILQGKKSLCCSILGTHYLLHNKHLHATPTKGDSPF
ncbi:hypothetical protein UlMin_003650 [Ulmus minor]